MNASRAVPIPFLALVLHGAVALPLALGLNIWFDEAYSLDTTSGTFLHALRQALWFEEQAPLYYLALWLWRQAADPIWFARLFSVLCTLGSVLLVPELSRRYLPDRPPWILTVLFALHPTAVWAATEVRSYGLSLFLGLLLLLTFHRAHQNPGATAVSRLLFVLAAATALYTNYFLGFLLAGLIAGRISTGPRTAARLRPLGTDLLYVAALFLPLAACLPRQIIGYADIRTEIPPDPLSPVPETVLRAIAYTWAEIGGSFLDKIIPAPYLKDWLFPRFVAFVAFVVALWSRRHRLAKGERFLWTVATVCLALCTAAATAVEYIGWRHTSIFLPVVLPLLVLALPRRPVPAVAVLLSLYLACLAIRYAPVAKNGDYIRVAKFLDESAAPGDPVLVYDPIAAVALEHYLRKPHPLLPLPHPEEFREYDFASQVLSRPEDVLAPLDQRVPGSPVWLVQDSGLLRDREDLDLSFAILEDVVASHFHVLSDHAFHGTRVRRLRVR